jgi:hypothetical protein
MSSEQLLRSFEAHGTRRGYCLALAIDPTEERRYADRHIQELFDAWRAAIRSVNPVADLADRRLPDGAYKRKRGLGLIMDVDA